eukprot:6207054-Alexandrium_andersonii.AAC.1
MSASLVGSEMCIRDSPWRPAAFWRHCQIPGARPRWKGRGWRCLHGAGAVSYTHLTLPTICSV